MNDLSLPDIASQPSQLHQTLEWVGMTGIALPVQLAGEAVSAYVNIGVSLDDSHTRGIHMSRLYLAAQRLVHREVEVNALRQVLDDCLASHQKLSASASLSLRGEVPLQRPALISPLSGWKSYPFEVRARLDENGLQVELQLEISYSSTCPCSAALARQLIQQRFLEDFPNNQAGYLEVADWLGSPQGIVATPHSQRSTATLQLRLDESVRTMPIWGLIEQAEQALGTPVQTAVKRADEQAFALANGQNLMFCEDAARRLHKTLVNFPRIRAFHLRVVHAESLHAHDATAQSHWNWY